MKSFFLKPNNAEAIWEMNPIVFSKLKLSNGLEVNSEARFRQFIDETEITNDFFKFIIVKPN
ncbi:MAG: hypothetical protein IPO92_13545 [Saprospiraceae bacterium]|nr:hypothetical protein [Saprospiraceae bacterium]